jgi:hypothetical protein
MTSGQIRIPGTGISIPPAAVLGALAVVVSVVTNLYQAMREPPEDERKNRISFAIVNLIAIVAVVYAFVSPLKLLDSVALPSIAPW